MLQSYLLYIDYTFVLHFTTRYKISCWSKIHLFHLLCSSQVVSLSFDCVKELMLRLVLPSCAAALVLAASKNRIKIWLAFNFKLVSI